ncbi:MAG TPA: VWA domain-containing protein, partial [Vicinamibacteria bacterium]
MKRRRRHTEVFGLSFMDCICCGFGATILLYMILNSGQSRRADDALSALQAETNRLEQEVLEGQDNLVELRNTLQEVRQENATTAGLSTRLIDVVKQSQDELATFEEKTLAQRSHINKLQADLRSLDEGAKRLSGGSPSKEVPGDKVRSFVGDGDRQYLTGLKVGGRHVLLLVDASASMLADTVVNAVRRKLLPEADRRRADKWRRAVRAADW